MQDWLPCWWAERESSLALTIDGQRVFSTLKVQKASLQTLCTDSHHADATTERALPLTSPSSGLQHHGELANRCNTVLPPQAAEKYRCYTCGSWLRRTLILYICVNGGQRETCGHQLSPSTMWVPRDWNRSPSGMVPHLLSYPTSPLHMSLVFKTKTSTICSKSNVVKKGVKKVNWSELIENFLFLIQGFSE